MDPFLLAAWALEGGTPERAVDIGTGSGIMALLLARRGVWVRAVDVRPEWIELVRRSAAESALELEIRLADARTLPQEDLDLALLNPPYLERGRGRPSADPWKAAARMELNGCLSELIEAGARQARRLCVVIDARRADEAWGHLEAAGLHPSRRCDIDRSLTLLEACRRPGEAQRERVSMRGPDGAWSDRVRAWYASLDARLG
jgi:tRNA1Val (adenine37-N6)-methyltransferase